MKVQKECYVLVEGVPPVGINTVSICISLRGSAAFGHFKSAQSVIGKQPTKASVGTSPEPGDVLIGMTGGPDVVLVQYIPPIRIATASSGTVHQDNQREEGQEGSHGLGITLKHNGDGWSLFTGCVPTHPFPEASPDPSNPYPNPRPNPGEGGSVARNRARMIWFGHADKTKRKGTDSVESHHDYSRANYRMIWFGHADKTGQKGTDSVESHHEYSRANNRIIWFGHAHKTEQKGTDSVESHHEYSQATTEWFDLDMPTRPNKKELIPWNHITTIVEQTTEWFDLDMPTRPDKKELIPWNHITNIVVEQTTELEWFDLNKTTRLNKKEITTTVEQTTDD